MSKGCRARTLRNAVRNTSIRSTNSRFPRRSARFTVKNHVAPGCQIRRYSVIDHLLSPSTFRERCGSLRSPHPTRAETPRLATARLYRREPLECLTVPLRAWVRRAFSFERSMFPIQTIPTCVQHGQRAVHVEAEYGKIAVLFRVHCRHGCVSRRCHRQPKGTPTTLS